MTRMARTGVTEMGQTITIQGGAAFPTAHDPLELNLRSVNHRRIKANPLNPTHQLHRDLPATRCEQVALPATMSL